MLIKQLSKCCRTFSFVSTILLSSTLITGCNSGGDTKSTKEVSYPAMGDVVAPKRTAYPRIEPYADSLKTITLDHLLKVNVNAQATTQLQQSQGATWLTVQYPRYDAMIYCTLTPGSGEEEIAKILDNRLERIGLNAGGNKTTIIDVPNPEGIYASLYTTAESRTTPLQFVAVAANGVFSGSVFFNNVSDTAPLDSLAPMVDVLRRDVTTLLSTLSYDD